MGLRVEEQDEIEVEIERERKSEDEMRRIEWGRGKVVEAT